MKTLYLDLGMGAAGDMLTAALAELTGDVKKAEEKLNAIGLPGIRYESGTAEKCGVTGTHMKVTYLGEEEGEEEGHSHDGSGHDHDHGHEHGEHGHSHMGLAGVRHIVTEHVKLPEKVAEDIMNVYGIIAEAESAVHGVPVEEIHFHEVGQMDAVADICAVCFLMDMLSPDAVIASPLNTGSGTVKAAHGILPVPAPATALILKDIPSYSSGINGELLTPTGAALVKYFATSYGPRPVMNIASVGYGMGKKDFGQLNAVRAFIGESEKGPDEYIYELSFNVDDMTGEAIGYASQMLMDAGARDVYTIGIGMKKNRPGVLVRVLCAEKDREKMVRTIFRNTTTIGIRECMLGRYTLERRIETEDTPYGPVRTKVSEGYGSVRRKKEFDDISRIATERGISLYEADALTDDTDKSFER